MKTTIVLIVLGLVLLGGAAWYYLTQHTNEPSAVTVLSFEDCATAGYPVMESHPRQCRTPDGRLYAEELPVEPTYVNASADVIRVTTPPPGGVTGKEVTITGEARGNWYFEASFPVEILDKDGKQLVAAPAQAHGDWMTTEFVPFSITLSAPQSYIGPATIVLHKDNPSGLPENESSLSIPITIEY